MLLLGYIHFAQATCPMALESAREMGLQMKMAGRVASFILSLATPGSHSHRSADGRVDNLQRKRMGWSHVSVSNASHLHMDFYADVPLGEQPPVHFSFDLHRVNRDQ